MIRVLDYQVSMEELSLRKVGPNLKRINEEFKVQDVKNGPKREVLTFI